MITEIGHFALILAFVVALAQGGLGFVGAAKHHHGMMASGAAAAWVQFGLVLGAFLVLMRAYVVSDFSVVTVFANSHTAKPLLYKIAGVWGNHEGSMLLWVLILALFGAAVAVFGKTLPSPLKSRVIALHGVLGALFLFFVLIASNPFSRQSPAPENGQDLNPLLQDPGLAFHPPLLYLGYVGLSTTFAFALAALIDGKIDAAWARWVRPWTLAAWICLTAGIALGSWWAYYELGWGGFWFWDPVENASLMPWLAATALLHSAIVAEKRDALKGWTVLLALLAFSFSLLGTFLVRSGVLTSVHAFATDPTRGIFILGILLVVIGGAFSFYAVRAPHLRGGGLFAPVSREGALVLNNLLISALAVAVLIGTLYPLFIDALSAVKISVGPPYFLSVTLPLAAPLIILMGVGPLMPWKRADLAGVMGRLTFTGIFTGVAVLLLGLFMRLPLMPLLGFAFAIWLTGAVLTDLVQRSHRPGHSIGATLLKALGLPRATWGMVLAHGGLAISLAGIAGAGLQTEVLTRLAPGQEFLLDGRRLVFEGVTSVAGPNYTAHRGQFRWIDSAGKTKGILTPEKRAYPVAKSSTTEAAIRSDVLGDTYLVLGEADAAGAWSIRAYRNPLAPWIWAGALIMAAGGVLSLSDRRWRIGAPRKVSTAAKMG